MKRESNTWSTFMIIDQLPFIILIIYNNVYNLNTTDFSKIPSQYYQYTLRLGAFTQKRNCYGRRNRSEKNKYRHNFNE